MNRIMVIGCGGAGKSTFSKKLCAITHHELIHLDLLYWKPGWVKTQKDEFEKSINHIVKKESWIIDGNYFGTLNIRIERADTIIFFDFPTLFCLWNVLKRLIKSRISQKKRDDLTPGCNDYFNRSFYLWVWNFNRNIRPKYLELLKNQQHEKSIYIFRDYSDVDDFLERLKAKS